MTTRRIICTRARTRGSSPFAVRRCSDPQLGNERNVTTQSVVGCHEEEAALNDGTHKAWKRIVLVLGAKEI